MPLRIVQDPIAEPLSLAEAKNHLRVDSAVTDDDALISALIASARVFAENRTRRAFVSQSWKLVLDSFPGMGAMGVPWGKGFTLPGNAIFLEKSQVRAVTAIKYLDMTGVVQTMPATDYIVDYTSEPCRITPVFGKIWPIPMPQIGAVEVDFVAGYAAPFTANTVNGQISVQGPWETKSIGDPIRFSNVGGVLPAPLQAFTDYFIQSVVAPGIYTLAATAGGAAITLTTAGTGNSFMGAVPDGIRSWMKIRIASLYEFREEVALLPRGQLQAVPFVDGLLDPYMVHF